MTAINNLSAPYVLWDADNSEWEAFDSKEELEEWIIDCINDEHMDPSNFKVYQAINVDIRHEIEIIWPEAVVSIPKTPKRKG